MWAVEMIGYTFIFFKNVIHFFFGWVFIPPTQSYKVIWRLSYFYWWKKTSSALLCSISDKNRHLSRTINVMFHKLAG
jgi:hypothetical protein